MSIAAIFIITCSWIIIVGLVKHIFNLQEQLSKLKNEKEDIKKYIDDKNGSIKETEGTTRI